MEIHNNAMVHFTDPSKKKMVITKHTFTLLSIFVSLSLYSLFCISQEMPRCFRFSWKSWNKIILKVWFRGDWYQTGSPPVTTHTCQGSPLARCYKSKTETVMKVNKWNQIKSGSPITGRATNGHWNGSNVFFPLVFSEKWRKKPSALVKKRKGEEKKGKKSSCYFAWSTANCINKKKKCRSAWNCAWRRGLFILMEKDSSFVKKRWASQNPGRLRKCLK